MLGLYFYLYVVVIIQFFKIKILDLKLTVLNNKEYKIIIYDKLAYYISLLGDHAGSRKSDIVKAGPHQKLFYKYNRFFILPQLMPSYLIFIFN